MRSKLRVLIGCEESGIGRNAFILENCYAVSCDIIPARDGGCHLQKDIKHAIVEDGPWDIIILHPDCTEMTLAGNRWYGVGKPQHQKRLDAIAWTVDLWELAKKYARIGVVLENPKSVIWQYLKGGTRQTIHPWQFGHGEVKPTGLQVFGLPLLVPTWIVDGREQRVWKMAPSKNRKRDRSESYPGIMQAMAEQYTKYALSLQDAEHEEDANGKD